MGEMEMIRLDDKGQKTAVIFKDDGSTVVERAFQCETCHKYYAESKLFTKWLSSDDAYIECEECAK